MAHQRQPDVHDLLGQTLALDPRQRIEAVRLLSSTLGRTAEVEAAAAGPGGAASPAVVDEVWDRVIELAADPDHVVRRTVLHALANEAPDARSGEVGAVLCRLTGDVDDGLARRARKVRDRFLRDQAA